MSAPEPDAPTPIGWIDFDADGRVAGFYAGEEGRGRPEDAVAIFDRQVWFDWHDRASESIRGPNDAPIDDPSPPPLETEDEQASRKLGRIGPFERALIAGIAEATGVDETTLRDAIRRAYAANLRRS